MLKYFVLVIVVVCMFDNYFLKISLQIEVHRTVD
jgi:hypothetical protein